MARYVGAGGLLAVFDGGAVRDAGRVVTLTLGVGVDVGVGGGLAEGRSVAAGAAETGIGAEVLEVVGLPGVPDPGPQPVPAAARSAAPTVPTMTARVPRM
ncbi:hypothetical protein [Streptomyces vilmorinianum]|uniref:hypothetical protein n=1 Tax=Streptomyces vilmorinianum TaxID=3051092 RepID=UPI0010FAFE1C|nr:hypothetical protein [Streptomyces vilmorinianum]